MKLKVIGIKEILKMTKGKSITLAPAKKGYCIKLSASGENYKYIKENLNTK